MKVIARETIDSFGIELRAENKNDAVFITRFGLNATNKLVEKLATVIQSTDDGGEFNAHIYIGKNRTVLPHRITRGKK